MNETELQNFKLDEYKQEISVYKNYTEKLNDLKKIKEDLNPSFLFTYSIAVSVTFLTLITFAGDFRGDFWTSLIASILFAFCIHGVFDNDFFVNIKSFGRLNELKKEVSKTEELRTNSYKKLQPLEQVIRNYFENQLKDFFEKNIYRKRSGSRQFEESLSEFSSMIDEIKVVKLATTHLSLSEYEDYLSRRTIDHDFQTSKKTEKSDPIRAFARSISKIPIQKPEEFFAPERLYRTAKKIDNWDEINKKRKMTGLKGEEIAVVIEQEFLESIGRNDLAQKVRHVSTEDGDGLGYDILSFFESGREKYIEVKSTTVSLFSPFYLSRNELAFLKEHSEDAFIYRVLIAGNESQIKTESGREFFEKNDLIPVQYIVKGK